ncbi:MAG: tRNA (N6-isopentenyl adenosine(37)-C2)-methylthiotransferase MiaB [Firmicutes bacterium]|jgi:tRNA-2-methylthio-N6-dimethylallyladenosine synthase|nr:tRNA (N6-isopentenyl adenosine(37)-C2)-methylthiotransferase MiaB [Bacillota bacterium]
MVEQRLAHIRTFGCQMNERDTETIQGLLQQEGYGFTDNPEAADLILYNTCCVRENPERKVYGQVGMLQELKAKKPGLIIGICGCMPQQREELPVLLERLPHVDLFFGTHNIYRLPELLHRICATGERVVEILDEGGEPVEGLPAMRSSSFKAFVTIMHGCNNFCSYCIVPYVRGREHSRSPQAIVEEVQSLANGGVKEVTLLGQNVNSYGKDLQSDADFADLLEMVNQVPGIEWIRFTTSHPKDISDKLIRQLGRLEKVCEHLHLPVQAGSNNVLQRMNRRYTREYYLEIVERVRSQVPGISLTTDIMVGFPGESDADFADTLSLVEEVGFDSAFTFIYSPRKGTPATEMPDQVPEEVKKERIYQLIELQNKISLERNQAQVGSEVEVLVEGASKSDTLLLTGKTRTSKTVLFPGSQDLIGQLVRVKITAAQTWSLTGELI